MGYVPARCRVCDAPFRLLPGDTSDAAGAPATLLAGTASHNAAQSNKEVQDLRSQVKQLQGQLEKQKAAAQQSQPATEQPKQPDPALAADKAEQKVLQRRIADLKAMESGMRDQLCQPAGGYEVVLGKLKAELQQSWDKQRSAKPLAQQKASIEAFPQAKAEVQGRGGGRANYSALQSACPAGDLHFSAEADSSGG